ncbi:hypothetical protein NTGBS_970015 [Candidatus Nitrotoga sp. BS]|nr:hypothetical protein NTGBS_970015 [Candidatus Nitrotoga sp. BS]
MVAGGGSGGDGDELGVLVDDYGVLVAIVALPAFLRPAGITVFLHPFDRVLIHPMGIASALMMALVSRPLRWIGTGIKVASMI